MRLSKPWAAAAAIVSGLGFSAVPAQEAGATEAPVPPEAAAPAEPAEPPWLHLVESPGEGARCWPRWRGPSGQGVAPGSGYTDTWSDKENILWRVPVPGSDHASPVVWGDWIFLTTSYPQEDRRSLLGFRRSDGALMWETFAPAAKASASERRVHHAIASPATDGERVYAFLGKHGVIAVTLDGNPVWHRDLGPADHATSSPLVHGGRVYVVQIDATREGSFLIALDAATGDIVWEAARNERMSSGTPILIRVEDREQLLANGQQQLQAYDPASGRELWKARGNLDQVVPTPVVGGELVFSISGPSGPIFGVFPDGRGNVTDTHIPWKLKQGGSFIPSAIYWDGYLYLMNDMACVLVCLEASIGRIVYQQRVGELRREGFVSSPVVADGKLFFTSVTGETFVVAPGPTFEQIRKNVLGEPVRASPALTEGRWYFRTERHLVAIGR